MSAQNKLTEDDKYIWLEEVESERSMNWVKAQNKLAIDKISSEKGFNTLQNKFEIANNDKSKIPYPQILGEYVYNFWQDETHIRGLWRRMLKADYLADSNEWEAVLDIDKLAETEGIKWTFKGVNWLHPENKLCLVNLSDGGTDEGIIREFNTETKRFVNNGFETPPSKGSADWIDENTLLITHKFEGENTLTESGYPRIAKTWKRGTALSQAEEIYKADKKVAGVFTALDFTKTGTYTFVYTWISALNVELRYWKDSKLTKVDFPKDADIKGMFDNKLLLHLQVDWEENGQVYKTGSLLGYNFDTFIEGKKEIEIIYEPDEKSSLISVSITKDFLVLNTMQNVQSKLLKSEFVEGKWQNKTINTPNFGSIYVISADKNSNAFFYNYSNFITPSTLFYIDEKGTKTVKQQKALFNTENLEVNQYEVASKDGTMIPYYVVHAKNIELNGENPTLVYAYGGFNIAVKPDYKSNIGIGWLEQGGVYVLANIRGGGEFGPAWHQGAMREKRQNAYNDFYAVCEDIISKKISSPKHLGAYGWSNGGLLAGVVTTQRPELFNAVVIGAPLLDMKRFNKMLAGASWMGEYGNPDVPEDWAYLQKYSPYHNLKAGVTYPEVLFMTSTKDDRVHPAHARKMAAKMMEMDLLLFYYETIEGGHSAASTNAQRAFNSAILFSYLSMKLK